MTIVAEPPVVAHSDEAPVIAPSRPRWRADAGWASLALVLVVGVYVMVYARNGRFFYWDDVQHAYTGMSSAIGRELRDGQWPLDFRASWLYSMLPSDPQFGLFHPFQLLVHVFVSGQEDLARTAFLVATAYAAIATGGAYCAARAAGCRPVFAAGAAVAIALNIHTLYYLSPSWQTHAAGVAWFTWFIAALLLVRRKPVLGPLAIIPTYLFMTSGYPHAAAAGVVVAAVLLGRDLLRRARPAREWVPMVSGLGAGALLGSLPWLLALAYVPYVERPSGLETVNDGGFIVHAESFLLSFSPFDRPFMINFGGSGFTDQPITYFIWTIPAAVVLFVATRRRLAEHIDLAIAAGVLCLAMTGPEVFGPIRWPFRFTPFAAMMAVLAATAIIDHASRRGITRPLTTTERRVLVIAGVALVLLAGALRPEPIVLVGTAFLIGVATPLVVWLARQQRATLLGSLIVAGSTLAVVVVALGNEQVTELGDWGGAELRSEVETDVQALDGVRALVLLSGSDGVPNDPASPTLFRRLPSGQYPLISERIGEIVGTGHAATPHKALEDLMCAGPFGWVCPDAPRAVFTPEPQTGQTPVDLMDIDRILVQRGPVLDAFLGVDPAGWEEIEAAEQWVLFGRSAPSSAPSDTVSWADPDVAVTTDGASEHVDAPDGGRIVLSRPWVPGLQISVGDETFDADVLEGIYPVVDLPPGTSGELSVTYRLPRLRLLALAVAGGIVLAGVSIFTALRLRSRGRRTARPAEQRRATSRTGGSTA